MDSIISETSRPLSAVRCNSFSFAQSELSSLHGRYPSKCRGGSSFVASAPNEFSRRLLSSLCVLLPFIFGCENATERHARESREAATQSLQAGREAWKAHKRPEAMRLFSQSIAACPTTAAYNERANAYAATHQDEQAASDVERGLAIDPGYAELLELRSLLKKRQAERDKKIAEERNRANLEAMQQKRAEQDRLAMLEQAATDRAMADRKKSEERQRAQIAFDQAWNNLPGVVELPQSVGEQVSVAIPAIPDGQEGFDLQLSGDPEIALERQPAGQIWSVSHGRRTIGTFSLKPGKLEFAWEKGLNQTTDLLRHCALNVRAAGKSHQFKLRVSLRGPALDISFAKDVTFEPLPITDTPAEDLALEFIAIEGISGEAKPTRVNYNEPMHVVLVQATNAEAGVELTLKLIKKGEQPTIEMRPLIVDTTSKTFPLSLKRLETMSRRVEKELPRQQNELANMQGNFVGLQQMGNYLTAKLNGTPPPILPTNTGYNDLAQLNPRDPAERTRIELKLQEIDQELGDLARKIKSKAINVNRMTGQEKILPKLTQIGSAADDSASLKLRILKRSSGGEIEIMTLDQKGDISPPRPPVLP
jgi:hypothetical protein